MSIKDVKYLVLGGDGLIGSHLVKKLRSFGLNVVATTRRVSEQSATSIYLDFSSDLSSWDYPANIKIAFLCAGITSMASCEKEPQISQLVNVTNTLVLAKKLYTSGTRIIFLSSNAVFDGTIAYQEEDGKCSPSTEYGRQKVSVEKELTALSGGSGSIAVIRLSKVLTARSGIAAEFIKRFNIGETCQALDDIRISPVSIPYVLKTLIAVAETKWSGIFHLSGAEEMTYAEFARRLAVYFGANQNLAKPLSSKVAGVNALFRPEHPALGMKRTSELIGVAPEKTDDLFGQLFLGN